MRRFLPSVIAFMLIAAGAVPLSAQESEEQAVRDVVTRLFDGMRTRDTAMMRTVFAEPAQFFGLGQDGGVRVDTPDDFMKSIAAAPAHLVLDEVLHDVEIRIDGPLATVWTYYDFFVGERFSHCGYDAMQLLKVQGAWKIVALADTRRQEGCRQQRG
jgi:hypothetical protein